MRYFSVGVANESDWRMLTRWWCGDKKRGVKLTGDGGPVPWRPHTAHMWYEVLFKLVQILTHAPFRTDQRPCYYGITCYPVVNTQAERRIRIPLQADDSDPVHRWHGFDGTTKLDADNLSDHHEFLSFSPMQNKVLILSYCPC